MLVLLSICYHLLPFASFCLPFAKKSPFFRHNIVIILFVRPYIDFIPKLNSSQLVHPQSDYHRKKKEKNYPFYFSPCKNEKRKFRVGNRSKQPLSVKPNPHVCVILCYLSRIMKPEIHKVIPRKHTKRPLKGVFKSTVIHLLIFQSKVAVMAQKGANFQFPNIKHSHNSHENPQAFIFCAI